MVWDLFRTKKEKPAAVKTGYWRIVWRRWWDSNPRTLADQTISSRSRYDHFDTSPYLSQHQHLRKRGELMGRTKKNIKFKIPEKPRKIKGFRSGGYRIATTISSQPRYDHFDTSPYSVYRLHDGRVAICDNSIILPQPKLARKSFVVVTQISFVMAVFIEM